MGYKVLIHESEEGRRFWDRHPKAGRWNVIDGCLILYYKDSHVIVKYGCDEWIKVVEMK